jgi:hypothetical protein
MSSPSRRYPASKPAAVHVNSVVRFAVVKQPSESCAPLQPVCTTHSVQPLGWSLAKPLLSTPS